MTSSFMEKSEVNLFLPKWTVWGLQKLWVDEYNLQKTLWRFVSADSAVGRGFWNKTYIQNFWEPAIKAAPCTAMNMVFLNFWNMVELKSSTIDRKLT